MTVSHELRLLDQELTAHAPATTRTRHAAAEPLPGRVDVLILTRAADREADFLVMALRAVGVAVHRVEIDHPPALEVSLADARPALLLDGQPVDPHVVLLRYFSPAATGIADDAVTHEFVRNEWRAFIDILRVVFDGKILNSGATPESIDAVTQLLTAKRCGFEIPATRITNTFDNVCGSTIIKTVSTHNIEPAPGTLYTVSPVTLELDHRPLPQQLAPVVAQARVRSSTEVRVYVVDDAVVAYRVSHSDSGDRWRAPSTVRVTSYDLPPRHQEKFLALASACGLDLCAIDAFLDEDRAVFLEVNPVFNWMWYEARADQKTVSMHIVTAITERVIRRRAPYLPGSAT
ncbi:hypothetical protein NBRGN_057_02870 [Nocardia brasiliensis NBRC 14402]|uniref:hypothetical protein n=1 Tax=Nocardia brasiliensis TaxID=37326 RepID=UPI0003174575|nr:hypothetical protein [Nocardia brasiliensis]ASF11676.1 hypothetical protein CEQ30_34930 [Nocardia brasiliensis]GAJ82780.1 hypothetical protein NBRGN_057_02870 [Nocardia brasiliensis NBRC 14402]SUB09521.1 Glutathione synthase/Ribosomal protein S6 modification enzyme (glutaminyl transferase) [Nocardia brasiliensis]